MSEKSALVVLSGGQDSTTCLYLAKKEFAHVHALTFDYGQRHRIEIEAATTVAEMAQVESHEIVRIPSILEGTSPLVSNAELGQYKDWQSLPGGLEATFVPGRNALFMVLAANRAYCKRISDVFMGICQEDFGGYPDCREEFRQAMQKALVLGLEFPIRLHAPLMFMTKAESVRLAKDLNNGCWEALAYTHTAYDGQYPPNGKDHATLLRAKGFEQAELPDPLVVRAWKEGLMPLPETSNYSSLR